MISFILTKSIIFSMFHEHKNTKLNHFSPISKVANFWVLQELAALQNDVVQCLVSFELVFPPSFFDIMTHLLVHLVKEINILGLVFLHNMFPFERFMGVLKNMFTNVLNQKEAS